MLKGAPKHDAYTTHFESWTLLIRNERGRHFARRHAISAIGHGVGHIDDTSDDIDDSATERRRLCASAARRMLRGAFVRRVGSK